MIPAANAMAAEPYEEAVLRYDMTVENDKLLDVSGNENQAHYYLPMGVLLSAVTAMYLSRYISLWIAAKILLFFNGWADMLFV